MTEHQPQQWDWQQYEWQQGVCIQWHGLEIVWI